jgi:hypothetical protein
MLIIESIETLIQGINKIQNIISFAEDIYNKNILTMEEQKYLKINIDTFNNNLDNLKVLSEYYSNVDKIEQQNIINTALDLYNNVNYLKSILDQI